MIFAIFKSASLCCIIVITEYWKGKLGIMKIFSLAYIFVSQLYTSSALKKEDLCVGLCGPKMGHGPGGVFFLVTFLFIACIIIYLIVQNNKQKGTGNRETEQPLEILKRRYAKGEISKEQFDEIKKDFD